jgi:hypothetical protein
MRPISPTKILTFETAAARKLAGGRSLPDRSRPDLARLRRGSIETALEVEFRGVENLLRSMEDLAYYWTSRRSRL